MYLRAQFSCPCQGNARPSPNSNYDQGNQRFCTISDGTGSNDALLRTNPAEAGVLPNAIQDGDMIHVLDLSAIGAHGQTSRSSDDSAHESSKDQQPCLIQNPKTTVYFQSSLSNTS